jgi:hypothetical protein
MSRLLSFFPKADLEKLLSSPRRLSFTWLGVIMTVE